jgi:hypothetical protein
MEEAAMGRGGAATWKGFTLWMSAPMASKDEEDAELCAIASKQERAVEGSDRF